MGQMSSVPALEEQNRPGLNGERIGLEGGPGLIGILSGCSAPCYDASTVGREGSNSLTKVVQHCCLSSEREGVLELVEQKRVIGDDLAVIEGDACSLSLTMGASSRTGFQRSSLVVGPHRERRFDQCYELFEQIGEGSFGNVYTATALSTRSEAKPRQVAVKIFSIAKPDTADEGNQRLPSFLAECAMLAQLEHPHIVRMHECFLTETELHLALEICHGGELYAYLITRIKEAGSGGLPEREVQLFFRQMLRAIAYLHSNRIVHRDIKPENFLLLGWPGSPEARTLKLCDFGTAMLLTDKKPRSMVNIGTLSYTAPEVYAHRGADLPADTWSLGVVLYVMLTGTNPFRGSKDSSKQETVRKIKSGMFATQRASWLKVTESGQDVVKRLLVLNEQLRLTCQEALSHVWLADAPRILISPDEEEPETLAVTAMRFMCQVQGLEEPQRVALAACAMSATEADLDQPSAWRGLFQVLDQDNDGRLSFDELCGGLRRLAGIPPSEVSDDELMSAAIASDFNGSGSIEWAEWLAVALLSLEKLSEVSAIICSAHRLLDGPAVKSQPQVSRQLREFAGQLRRGTGDCAHDTRLSIEDLRLVVASCQGHPV